MTNEADALVRRVDEDRWLASRFARPIVRERLVTFYALQYEIARTAETVTQEGLGHIRLQWWRDAVEEIYSGVAVRAHPVLEAYAALAREDELPREPLDQMIDARAKDFEPAPFADWAALDAYVDATAGNTLRLAMAICGGVAEPLVTQGGRAWGYAGLMRAHDFWAARGRRLLPQGETMSALRKRAWAAYYEVRALAAKLPPAAFPAIGYLCFTPMYLRALEHGRGVALLTRQIRIAFASATGGI